MQRVSLGSLLAFLDYASSSSLRAYEEETKFFLVCSFDPDMVQLQLFSIMKFPFYSGKARVCNA